MVAVCAYMVFVEPRADTCSSKSDCTRTIEMGRLAFVLSLTLVTLNVTNYDPMLQIGQLIHLQSLLNVLE